MNPPKGTVGGNLLEARSERGDRPFLLFEDETYTYADMEEQSARVANGLREVGVAQHDNVALLLPNSPEFLFAWFGAARVGAPVVPVNVALKGDSLVHIVDHSDAKTLIVHADCPRSPPSSSWATTRTRVRPRFRGRRWLRGIRAKPTPTSPPPT
jgi:acyl-CoA synthetase (AMP-forming)/AMP-acid ligase II